MSINMREIPCNLATGIVVERLTRTQLYNNPDGTFTTYSELLPGQEVRLEDGTWVTVLTSSKMQEPRRMQNMWIVTLSAGA